MEDPEGLAEWAVNVPSVMRDDPIWRLPAYRFSLYLGDLAQLKDLPRVRRDFRTRRHVDQWIDAVESISANIAEGYGRTTGPERAKFYEYGQSSARESRDWYFKVRHALASDVATSRILLITRIMRVLTVAVVRERAQPETPARRAERMRRDSSQRQPRPPSAQH